MSILVTKASGAVEEFDDQKVSQSLRRAGVPESVVNEALTYVRGKLADKISTHLIYAYIQGFLRRQGHLNFSYNYDLKRAIMRLGPTGYPFESFVAKVLSAKGFETQVGVTLNGKCVTHEVDIEAKKGNDHFFIECKFHNQLGIKTDVQVALYTQARFEDIKNSPDLAGHLEKHRPWLITNTAVTKDVIDYAHCVDMKILSWGYPADGNLRDLIIATHFHPITVLQNLDSSQMASLLDRGIVTLDDLKAILTTGQLPQNISKDLASFLLTEIQSYQ